MPRAAFVTTSATFLFIVLAASACRERKDDAAPLPAAQASTPAPPPSPTPPAPPPAPPSLVAELSMADDTHAHQLVNGFYEKEGEWRWTNVSFTVKLAVTATAREKGGILRLFFSTPKALLAQNPSVTVKAKVGNSATSKTFTGAGDHKLELEVPTTELASDAVVADFSVAKPYTPGGGDIRVLGVITSAVELATK
jgi:hypothetical protein